MFRAQSPAVAREGKRKRGRGEEERKGRKGMEGEGIEENLQLKKSIYNYESLD